MAYYKREDFKVFIETYYNKYGKNYIHVLRVHKILKDDKYENIDMYNSTICSSDLDNIIKKYEDFKDNFIVVSSTEINLSGDSGYNYDTIWFVDFDKNIVKCLNGITGYESYYIDTILDFKGNIFVPCAGTKNSWNRLEINYPEFREQLERILNENNYDYNVARQERIVKDVQDELMVSKILGG